MTKPTISNPHEISGPTDVSNTLTEEGLLEIVQKTLVPMVDKFVETHRGKEFTADDIEGLYHKLSDTLRKDPRIADKYEPGANYNRDIREQAKIIAEEINKENPLKFRDKLIRGFADFCNKIGLEEIGTACLKHIAKVDLTSKLDVIAAQVKKTKSVDNDINKISPKPIKKSPHLEH